MDFLSSCELQQVVFNASLLIFNFDKGVTLSVESFCEALDSVGVAFARWRPNDLSSVGSFGELFGKRILNCEVPGDGTLVLHFDGKNQLKVYDSNKEYESYQISGGGQNVIV